MAIAKGSALAGSVSRRRVIRLMAAGTLASGALAAIGGTSAWAALGSSEVSRHHWQGRALGAEVSLQIYHADKGEATRLIENAVNIVRRMEGFFSLYQTDSLLNQLNTQGQLLSPAVDFVDLMTIADRVSRLSDGAFDITVQPLWQFYQTFFGSPEASVGVIPADRLGAVRDLVGYDRLSVSAEKISFDRPGMAATLNGIAQGYATDRVAGYFAQEGLTSVLVDLGEFRALGPQAGDEPWRIGLQDPFQPGRLEDVLDVVTGAVATSSGRGDVFEAGGTYHHLLDPKTGLSSQRYVSVTVTAPEAAIADALSTAFCAMSEADIRQCLKAFPGARARLTLPDGAVKQL